jgi:ubiquitin-conjugating enzyme E2 variant
MTRPDHPDTVVAGIVLPRHDDFTGRRRCIEATCIATAVALLGWHLARLASTPGIIRWWLPFAAIGGALAADFVSGLIHWTADTWGSETMPVLGRRFVRPFRVHHVNPDDFLRRSFLDTNGDVAAIVAGFLTAGFLLPLDAAWGRVAAVMLVAFCVAGLPTNQIHQWAHMPRPPRLVRWLQDRRLVLGRPDHLRHHRAPYAAHYCIATGWLNRPLEAIGFFRRLEQFITRVTGLRPREDDEAFQVSVESGVAAAHTGIKS